MSDVEDLRSDIASRLAASHDYSVPALRRLRREISRDLRREDPRTVVQVALQLVSAPDVPRWFTYELINHPRTLAALTRGDVESLGDGMDSWGEVDAFSCFVAGPAFREGQLTTADLYRWARSADRWWRRAALVSTVPLNNTARGGRGDAKRTLAVCDRLRLDRDDMVVKAMSWALRELAKKEPRSVAAYLRQYRDELAARVLREVRNKLDTGLKNPRLNRHNGRFR
jgi:hypothetical protein